MYYRQEEPFIPVDEWMQNKLKNVSDTISSSGVTPKKIRKANQNQKNLSHSGRFIDPCVTFGDVTTYLN